MSNPTNENRSPERVVCAALRHADGAIICGARHFDKIMLDQMGGVNWRLAEQGFINQFGEFLTREKAYGIACLRQQIIRELEHAGGLLYSEHLY